MIRVQEAKQVGTLYHFTSIENAMYILKEDTLKSHVDTKTWLHNVSFTRDKNFEKSEGRSIGSMEVRLSFDGDKLSQKYKIKPYNYFNDYPGVSKTGVPHKDLEAEECIEGDLHNVSRYIIAVDILVDKYTLPFDYHYGMYKVGKAADYVWDIMSRDERRQFKDEMDVDFKIDTRHIARYVQDKYDIPCQVLKKR